jgi:DnaJ-class molecular chaperone
MSFPDCCPECDEDWYSEREDTGPESFRVHFIGYKFTGESAEKVECEGCGCRFGIEMATGDCPICGGSGYLIDEGYDASMGTPYQERRVCARCDGDGEVEPTDVDYIYKLSE